MEILNHAEEKMKKAVAVLEEDLKTIRTGIAHASLLVEGRQLVIKPYDRGTLKDIERAIQTSDTGLVPQSDGEVIRLNVPALTEERRKELAKSAHKMGEEAKIAIRNIRRDANDAVKKDKELTEDLKKDAQEKIQKLTDKIGKSIDSAVDTKAKEIMKV